MKSQFVPYEIALALKELGFDEECFGWFYLNKPSYIEYERCKLKDCSNVHIPSPLWQQVVDWFEQKHKIYLTEIPIYINRAIGDCELDSWSNNLEKNKEYATRYEAREAAILEAIKIVKGEMK